MARSTVGIYFYSCISAGDVSRACARAGRGRGTVPCSCVLALRAMDMRLVTAGKPMGKPPAAAACVFACLHALGMNVVHACSTREGLISAVL